MTGCHRSRVIHVAHVSEGGQDIGGASGLVQGLGVMEVLAQVVTHVLTHHHAGGWKLGQCRQLSSNIVIVPVLGPPVLAQMFSGCK